MKSTNFVAQTQWMLRPIPPAVLLRVSALSRTTLYVSFEIILAAFPFLGFTEQNNEMTINRDTRTTHHIRKEL